MQLWLLTLGRDVGTTSAGAVRLEHADHFIEAAGEQRPVTAELDTQGRSQLVQAEHNKTEQVALTESLVTYLFSLQ